MTRIGAGELGFVQPAHHSSSTRQSKASRRVSTIVWPRAFATLASCASSPDRAAVASAEPCSLMTELAALDSPLRELLAVVDD